MAKTITQAGGQTDAGILPTSQEITQNQTVRAATLNANQTTNTRGTSLSKDLMGIMDKAGKIVQERNQLSVTAAKRVATNSLSQMSMQMSELAAQRTPETDLREEQLANETIYQEFGRKTFDNEDAQRAFDDLYHTSAAPSVAKINSGLEQKALVKDAELLYKDIMSETSSIIESGMYTAEVKQSLLEKGSNNPFITKEKLEGDMLGLQLNNFDVTISAKSPEFIKSGGFMDNDKLKREFAYQFSDYVTLDDKGKLEYSGENGVLNNLIEKQFQKSKGALEQDAKMAKSEYETTSTTFMKGKLSTNRNYIDANGYKYEFITSPKVYESIINANFPDVDAEQRESLMNMFWRANKPTAAKQTINIGTKLYDNNKQGGAADVQVLFQNINSEITALTNAKNIAGLSASTIKKIDKSIDDLVTMQNTYMTVNSIVNKAISNDDYVTLENDITNGRTVNGIYIGNTFVKNRVAKLVNETDEALINYKFDNTGKNTEEQKKVFQKFFIQQYKLSNAGAIPSKFMITTGKEFNSNLLNSVKSVSDAQKMLIVANVLSEESNNAYKIVLNKQQIKQLSEIVDDTTVDEATRVSLFNKLKSSFKIKRDAVINGSIADTKKGLKSFASLGTDSVVDQSVLNWVIENDTTLDDKTNMTEDEMHDMMLANTFVYKTRESDKGFVAGVKEVGRGIASFVSDAQDGISLPNRIGTHTNTADKPVIQQAFTGALRALNRDLSDVKVYATGNSVILYDKTTNKFLTEIHQGNLQTFSKNGK